MSDKKLLKVKVRDTENILFEGEIDRITSFNEVGPFDIYPMHANFISILNNKVTLYNQHKIVKELTFEQAVMKVKKDEAHIYLGIEVFFLEESAMTKDNKSTHNLPKK